MKVCRKPGSVLLCGMNGNYPPALSDNHLSRPSITVRLQRPTRTRLGLRLLQEKLRSIRSCSRWGLPGTKSPAFLGVSYTSVPSLPVPLCSGHRRSISVALSFDSRRLDVIQHPALWSPDFPPAAYSRRRLSVKLS